MRTNWRGKKRNHCKIKKKIKHESMQKQGFYSSLKVIGFLIFFIFCQEKKEESLIDTFSKISLVSLATSSSKCQISSANNTDYFVSGSIPDGGTISVEWILSQSGNTN